MLVNIQKYTYIPELNSYKISVFKPPDWKRKYSF